MIPKNPEYLPLRYLGMPPTQVHKCLLISALCRGDQIIVGDFRVTTSVIAIAQARS
jgi:hypothetical protein